MRSETTACPDPETLAAFAEGKIERARIPALLAHLDGCEECTRAVSAANDTIRDERLDAARPAPTRLWMAIAAAVAVAVLSFAVLQWRGSPVAALVAASPHAARVVEPRLSGGFTWAPYRGPMRAEETAADPAHLRLAGAAADAVERGARDASPNAQHAAGIALVLTDNDLDAVARLRAAAERAPNDAANWSDLAAAEYTAASRLGRPSLYPAALGHADRALRLDARMPEALFNRALALERIGLADEARKAWQAYLAVDASSAWANEAREHLAHLSATSDAETFERDRPRLERAAADGDARAVAAIVDAHRERARTFGEAEYLGRWADAVRRNDASEAARWLAVARGIGDALVQLSGESMLHDAVRAIGAHGAALAEAHAVYRRGRMTYAKQQPGAAEPDLRRAAQLFAAADDPMSLVARWYAANARFDLRDVDGARAEIETLASELRTKRRYVALGAGVQWELALCRHEEGDVVGALAALESARTRYAQLGERSNVAAIENLRAAELDVLGRPDDAWTARIAALTDESRQRQHDRLARDLTTATAALVRAGERDAARSMLSIEESVDRALGSAGLLVHALAREARLDAALGDDERAAAAANEAREAAAHLPDPALRAREAAIAELAVGAAVLPHQPQRAKALLSGAFQRLDAVALWPHAAEAALLGARASARLGDGDSEARDLDAGIAALERYRVSLGGVGAPAVYDTQAELFADAVRLALGRGDVNRAFAYAERARGGNIDAHELQRRLAGSGAVVLESFVAKQEVFTFAVSEREAVAAKHPLPGGSDAELYDALIRPSAALLASARRIIIVPDRLFADVPYAALSDGKEPLVARMPVAVAISASALTTSPAVRPRSVDALALPTGDAVALPESQSELADVARLYPRASTTPRATFAALRDANTDVIHLAGHTADASGGAALLFGEERVPWSRVASLHFAGAPVVTLAACATLRADVRAGARSLSLGAAFLAAGARDVVGTLEPIADRDAHELFRRIHERLAAGVAPSEAVRETQLEELAAGRNGWRAVAVLTNRISN